jgi:hypothetical protein
MAYATFSGPIRVGSAKEGAARNTGNLVLSQSATVGFASMLQSPTAVSLFTLPAGSKILRFNVEKTTAISGGSVSAVNVTFGVPGTANLYMTSAAIGLTAIPTVSATLLAAQVPAQTNNVGTSDVTVTGTFTAVTGDPTAGVAVVTVEYIQRATDGSQYPAAV